MKKVKNLVLMLMACVMLLGTIMSQPTPVSAVEKTSPAITYAVKPLDSFTMSSNSQHNFGVFYLTRGTTVEVHLTASQLAVVEFLSKAPNGHVEPFGKWSTYGGTIQFTVSQTGNYTFYLNYYSAGSTTFYNVSIDY